MEPIQDTFPIFEANQVLSNSHLNQVFDYLDEQERLTRANLIGIGIVCGLELRLDATAATIHFSKGCGVTSQGYLIVEPKDVALVSYREYTLPSELDYPPLKDKSAVNKPQYPLWELFPAGEPNTTALDSPTDFLTGKAALLFLELHQEDIRNCSPNDCNDRGAKVTSTLRRLLIQTDDLKKIIAEANALATDLTLTDLETAILARLNLPDVRLPRYDVPNTGPATSHEVLAAFHTVFHTDKLAENTGRALTAAYNAFKPVVQKLSPSNPFVSFSANFGFLDTAPETTTQVRFLQYYYDFFDDLLKAYDEFRWKGAELMCACCPPDGLFPRHLMLGILFPAAVTNPSVYRHHFLPSAATSECEEHTKELKQLFQRLVEMIARFTNTPPLPKPSLTSKTDVQIRITPSKLADVPVSDKAIPYYYRQDGTPPLYRIWNAEKNRRNRANQNLSYRSDEYTPIAPTFVTNALNYDLEPYNFLRIEGHLGKPYRSVLKTLLSLKTRHRLPIDIIALRAGAFDENMPVDLSREEGRFQDLEALYDTLREELLCTLCEGVRYLYDIVIGSSQFAGGTPKLPLLQKCAPNYLHKSGTVGAWYEQHLKLIQSRPYIDVDQNRIDNQVILVYCSLFTGTRVPDAKYYAHIVSIYYFTKLAEVLPYTLNDLGYADFENKYQDLMGLIRYFRSDAVQNISAELAEFIPQEDLIDHFDHVLFACKFEPIKTVHEEYVHRIRAVKQKQFLSFFLQNHPGVQHKAGVPLGGTFIIVYHDDPAPVVTDLRPTTDDIGVTVIPSTSAEINKTALAGAFARIGANPQFAANPDIRFLLGTFTGQIPDLNIALPPASSDAADKIIAATVNEFDDGTIIADFFLPYLCCSDGSPVQYVLPVPPLGLTVELGCTSPSRTAEATLTPQGGMAPITYQLDNQPFRELTGTLLLTVGLHTILIRDSAGAESALQSLTVPEPLTIGAETYTDDVSANTYTVSSDISGGTPPYSAAPGTVTGSTYTSPPVNSGETISVTVTDSVGCTVSQDFQHTVCTLPCGGQSRRCAYRLWVQPPFDGAPYEDYGRRDNLRFRFNGEVIEIPNADRLLQISTDELNTNFSNAIGGAVKILNEAINRVLIEKFGDEGNNRLVVTYKPTESDPFGIFRIEYFVCETFNIEFDFSFSKPKQAFILTVRYTNEPDTNGAAFDGAVFINRRLDNQETRVPAFDCSERNQCDDTDYTPLCDGPDPDPTINIDRLQDNRLRFEGKVNNMDESEIIAWVWDVLAAQPTEPFYEGQRVDVQVRNPAGPVRLTAITKKGCFGVTQKNIGQ